MQEIVTEAQQPLTDKKHWDEVWSFIGDRTQEAPPRLEPSPIASWLEQAMAPYLKPGCNFLEVGGGGSPWPAHVANQFGATAWAIDISRRGLAQTASACEPDAPVRLVEGDLFDRRLLPKGAFQVVYSGGFIEHFSDARPVAERLRELCAPGGVVITTVPNLAGVNGFLQRLVDPELFAAHVVFSPRSLDEGHARGGLLPAQAASFLGMIDLGAVNFMRLEPKLPKLAWRALWFALSHLRAAGEFVAGHSGVQHGGRLFAPMIGGVYRPEIRKPSVRSVV